MREKLIAESFFSDRKLVLATLDKYFVSSGSGAGATGKALDVKPEKYVNSMTIYLLKTTAWSTTPSNPWASTINIYISDQDIETGEQFSILLKSEFLTASSSNVSIVINIFGVVDSQPILLKQILWAPVGSSFNNLSNASILYKMLRSKNGSFKMIDSNFT